MNGALNVLLAVNAAACMAGAVDFDTRGDTGLAVLFGTASLLCAVVMGRRLR